MEVDWSKWEPNERSALVFVRKEDHVLLIRKKRGLGAGKINAPGGKIDPGETPLQAALRETKEEVGVTPLNLEPMGELFFQFRDGLAIHCTVYLAAGCRGKVRETEEAEPMWTAIEEIPYDAMWADDRFWLPQMLQGKRFRGYFTFDGDTMLSQDVQWEEESESGEDGDLDDTAVGKRAVDRLVAQLCPIVESLLIASKSPLKSRAIARIVREVAAEEDQGPKSLLPKAGARHVERAIAELNLEYEQEKRAFTVVERAAGWKIFTVPRFAPWVRAIYPEQKPPRLSAPALETLAIVAYRQPVTKADIESVRGVNVDGMLKVLLDRGLVRIAGRAEVPGRPLLYETTDLFLDHFGIRSVEELPNASELRRVKLPVAAPPAAPAEDSGEAPAPAPEEAGGSEALAPEPSVDSPEPPSDAGVDAAADEAE